jgi:hypothetical protein
LFRLAAVVCRALRLCSMKRTTPASTKAATQTPIAIPAFAPVAKPPKLLEVVSSYFRVKICSVMTVIPGIVALVAGTNV